MRRRESERWLYGNTGAGSRNAFPKRYDGNLTWISGIRNAGGTSYPQVIPNSPTFQVPANPLLPQDYNEILDYNAGQYLNGIFRTQIGRYVKVSQLVGSNTLEEFEGYLIGVGINYIILQDYITGNIRILDIYGIKNMYVYYANIRSQLSED